MIQLEHVSKKIKGKMVLEDINITFQPGKVYGLKGINGSGKTMLMRLISGLIYPTAGTVRIEGKCLGRELSFPRQMGILIENPVFLNAYTGMGNLKLLASLNETAGDTNLREALQRVGLDPEDKRKYKKYSLGMKQRLGIAAAIMENPRILLLDEPTNALDAEGTALFSKILEQEKEKGTLVMLSCHDESRLREYADIIVEIEDGRIKKQEACSGWERKERESASH